MPRGPARPHPPMTFREAAKLATAIRERNAGKPMNRLLLAEAMGRSPASSEFRDMIMSAARYNLIRGNYASEIIELTPLGEQYTRPTSEEERLEAERTAIRKVPLFDQILTHFNNNKIPPPDFLKNTLEREPFGVAPEWSAEVAERFLANGKAAGFVRMIQDSPWVIMEAGPATADVDEQGQPEAPEQDGATAAPPEHGIAAPLEKTAPPPVPSSAAVGVTEQQEPGTPTAHRQFFIAHGRNHKPLQQLQKILKELDIPYVVAEEEPNVGRPISQKVSDLIKSCSAGIFIFTGDEELLDKDGNTVLQPRQNVVYELGAASLQYGRRIVIFKEKGVTFPTDFRDLGYIEFDKDNLEGKSMELIRELIGLKAVRILPGT